LLPRECLVRVARFWKQNAPGRIHQAAL
jgi:hypothetical protein